MPRVTITIALAAALAFAGCLGGTAEETSPAGTDGTQAPAGSPDGAQAAPSEGADGPSTADEGTPAESSAVEVDVPVQFDGNLATGAWVCREDGATTMCNIYDAPTSAEKNGFEPGIADEVRGYHLELTWEALAPTSETLRLVLELCKGEECEHAEVAGTSPLTLHGTGEGWTVGTIHVMPEFIGGGPVMLLVEDGQPFTIAGSFRVAQAAP